MANFYCLKIFDRGKNIYDHKITSFDQHEKYFASQASLERTGGSPTARSQRELNPNQKMINRKTLGNFNSIEPSFLFLEAKKQTKTTFNVILALCIKILNFPYHCIILDHTTLTLEKLCQTSQGAWERYYPPNFYSNA